MDERTRFGRGTVRRGGLVAGLLTILLFTGAGSASAVTTLSAGDPTVQRLSALSPIKDPISTCRGVRWQ